MREREVMALLVSVLLNKQVGHQLGVTVQTVKAHRARVMAKMQADSLAALVRMSERVTVAGAV
jgi:FixJ family two-component response regulator